MSGGHFDYIDGRLKSEIFGWDEIWHNVFEDREISELVWDVLDLIHDFDWYKSGDTSEERYLKSKAAFKKKWFEYDRTEGIKRIIDEAVEELRKDLYKTYDIEKGVKSGECV